MEGWEATTASHSGRTEWDAFRVGKFDRSRFGRRVTHTGSGQHLSSEGNGVVFTSELISHKVIHLQGEQRARR